MSEAKKYNQIYDYLSAPDLPASAEPAVTFGRNDPIVAHKLGDLVIPGLVEIAVISGGVGKDTGDILADFDSEAGFLAHHLDLDSQNRGYTLPTVILDKNASNGRENARNSVALLDKAGSSLSSLTAVAHATSSLRLAETLKYEASQKLPDSSIPTIHRAPSSYDFDADNPADREEAASELLRLADWPASGNLYLRDDIPEDLVEFSREKHGNSPVAIKEWQSRLLRLLPKKTQLSVIQLAAKHGRK